MSRREYQVVWSGGEGLSGDSTLGRDYADMRGDGWDVIYEPPPVVTPLWWLRRYAEDEDNPGISTDRHGEQYPWQASRVIGDLKMNPRRIAAMLNAIFSREPIEGVARVGRVSVQRATGLRARFLFQARRRDLQSWQSMAQADNWHKRCQKLNDKRLAALRQSAAARASRNDQEKERRRAERERTRAAERAERERTRAAERKAQEDRVWRETRQRRNLCLRRGCSRHVWPGAKFPGYCGRVCSEAV